MLAEKGFMEGEDGLEFDTKRQLEGFVDHLGGRGGGMWIWGYTGFLGYLGYFGWYPDVYLQSKSQCVYECCVIPIYSEQNFQNWMQAQCWTR